VQLENLSVKEYLVFTGTTEHEKSPTLSPLYQNTPNILVWRKRGREGGREGGRGASVRILQIIKITILIRS